MNARTGVRSKGQAIFPSRSFVAVGMALGLLVGGCAWDGPQSTLMARSDLTRAINDVYAIITWATAVIGLLVLGVIAVILIRFRGRPEQPAPRQTRGHAGLEISWTIAPALVLLIIAVPTIQMVFRTQGAADPRALEIRVVGKQWWWEFQYPSLQFVTANELHVPAGRPILLTLHGGDVIHSFWAPQVAAKRDAIPGRTNRITFTADTPGEFWGQCAEFCGLSHALMAMRVIVDTPADFDRWVERQQAVPGEPSGAAADGRAIYAASACVGCHRINGVSAGALGPSLDNFGGRKTVGAGLMPNTVENVAAWIRDPGVLKPGVRMPALGLTQEQSRAVAEYLLSLK